MRRFEYLRVWLSGSDYADRAVANLNELGSEGWQVLHVTTAADGGVTMWAIREKEDMGQVPLGNRTGDRRLEGAAQALYTAAYADRTPWTAPSWDDLDLSAMMPNVTQNIYRRWARACIFSYAAPDRSEAPQPQAKP